MTRRPMSWMRAATASSSRSAQPTARPISSAACWVALAWTRNRSGRSSQPPLDSKKSKTGAVPAIARTPDGLSTSTAVGIVATSPDAGAVGEPQDRDRQRDVGLDRVDQVADPGAVGGRRLEDPGAGLDQGREALNRLERGSKASTRCRGRRDPTSSLVLAFGMLVEFDRANCALRESHRQKRTLGLERAST